MEDSDVMFNRAVKYIPKLRTGDYKERFSSALELADKNRQRDNPFGSIVGTYDVDIPRGANLEKVTRIQKGIADLIQEENPDLIFHMKPTDRNHIYVLESEGNESRKKLSRFSKNKPVLQEKLHKLMTQYPKEQSGSKAHIVISKDPVDLLRKSSSRSWVSESCEHIGGGYDNGPFSDIENNNAIAYLYFGDNTEPSGRYMLRWCKSDCDKVDVGMEPIMYPANQPFAMYFYEAVSDILKEKGFGDYDSCKTPYTYRGYSDQLGGSGRITYLRPGKDFLKQYAADQEISRNTARALLNAPLETKRVLAENPGFCKHKELVDRVLTNEDDEVMLANVIETCKPDMPIQLAERLITKGTKVKIAVAKYL